MPSGTSRVTGKPSKAAKHPPRVYCPVCPDWEIKLPDRCSNTLKHGERTLYFCTKRCKERFMKNPEKFAKP